MKEPQLYDIKGLSPETMSVIAQSLISDDAELMSEVLEECPQAAAYVYQNGKSIDMQKAAIESSGQMGDAFGAALGYDEQYVRCEHRDTGNICWARPAVGDEVMFVQGATSSGHFVHRASESFNDRIVCANDSDLSAPDTSTAWVVPGESFNSQYEVQGSPNRTRADEKSPALESGATVEVDGETLSAKFRDLAPMERIEMLEGLSAIVSNLKANRGEVSRVLASGPAKAVSDKESLKAQQNTAARISFIEDQILDETEAAMGDMGMEF